MTSRRALAGTAVTALLVLGPVQGAFAAETPSPMAQLIFEPLGGEMLRVPAGATALRRPDATFCYHALTLWMDPSQTDANVTWTSFT